MECFAAAMSDSTASPSVLGWVETVGPAQLNYDTRRPSGPDRDQLSPTRRARSWGARVQHM